jgi:hypothetical protein
MKTPSGTLKIVFAAVCGLFAVVCLRAVATPTPTPTPEIDPPMPPVANDPFVLLMNQRHMLADPSDTGEQAFAELICYSGHYPGDKGKKNVIHFRHNKKTKDGKQEHFLPLSCDQFPKSAASSQSSGLEIKTDKVIVSEKARTFEDGDLTLIAPHVTQQIAVSSQADLKAVVDSLAPQ